MSDSLAEALPHQMERVRHVLTQYEETQRECGDRVNCHFAIMMIKSSLAAAEKATAAGDVVAMLACYEDLKEIQ